MKYSNEIHWPKRTTITVSAPRKYDVVYSFGVDIKNSFIKKYNDDGGVWCPYNECWCYGD